MEIWLKCTQKIMFMDDSHALCWLDYEIDASFKEYWNKRFDLLELLLLTSLLCYNSQ